MCQGNSINSARATCSGPASWPRGLETFIIAFSWRWRYCVIGSWKMTYALPKYLLLPSNYDESLAYAKIANAGISVCYDWNFVRIIDITIFALYQILYLLGAPKRICSSSVECSDQVNTWTQRRWFDVLRSLCRILESWWQMPTDFFKKIEAQVHNFK